jgi:hypothetical protein
MMMLMVMVMGPARTHEGKESVVMQLMYGAGRRKRGAGTHRREESVVMREGSGGDEWW